jgi:hypothetical protein
MGPRQTTKRQRRLNVPAEVPSPGVVRYTHFEITAGVSAGMARARLAEL